MKRLIDILVAGFILVLMIPILLLAAVAIKITSCGAVIFAQPRVGRFTKVFTCYKLRTMSVGTQIAGTHEVSEDAVTTVGKILRSTKLDELPQLWNVIRGDMSIVGPRPCLTVQKELIAARESAGVFEILPGITGLSQIKGIDMSEPHRLVKSDCEYMLKQGVLLDLKITILTVFGRGRGDRIANSKSEF